MPPRLKFYFILVFVIAGLAFCVWHYLMPSRPGSSDPDIALAWKWVDAGDAGSYSKLKDMAEKPDSDVVRTYLQDLETLGKPKTRDLAAKDSARILDGRVLTRVKFIESSPVFFKRNGKEERRDVSRTVAVYLSQPKEGEARKVVAVRYLDAAKLMFQRDRRPVFYASGYDMDVVDQAGSWFAALERRDLEQCSKLFPGDPMDSTVAPEAIPASPSEAAKIVNRMGPSNGRRYFLGVLESAAPLSGIYCAEPLFLEIDDKGRMRTESLRFCRDSYWGASGKWLPVEFNTDRWHRYEKKLPDMKLVETMKEFLSSIFPRPGTEPDRKQADKLWWSMMAKNRTPINYGVWGMIKSKAVLVPASKAELFDYVKDLMDKLEVFKKNSVPLLDSGLAKPADLAGKSLILYGTPQANSLVRDYVAKFGWKIGPDEVDLGNGLVFKGERLVVVACKPDPANKKAPVLIYTAQRDEDLPGVNGLFHGPTEWIVAERVSKGDERSSFKEIASGDWKK